MSRSISRIIRLAVCALALSCLMWALDRATLARILVKADTSLLAGAVLLLAPSLLLLAARMALLVRACGGDLPFTRSLLILLAGNCTSTILPAGTVAGDGVRMVLLAQATGSRHAALVVVAADRLLGVAGLLCFPIIFAVWHTPIREYGRFSILIVAIAVGCAAFVCVWRLHRRFTPLVPKRVLPHVQRLGQSASVLAENRRVLAIGLGIAVLSHGFILFSLLLVATALGGFSTMNIGSAAAFVCLTALSLLASTLPFGVMEWCFAGLLGWQSGIMSPEVAVSVALFGRATQLLYGVPAAAWLLWTASPRAPIHEPDGEMA